MSRRRGCRNDRDGALDATKRRAAVMSRIALRHQRAFPPISLEHHKAVIVFSGMCWSMIVGVAFQSFLADRLGTGRSADAYYLGATVPTLIATALLGAAPNAL